MTIYKMAVPKTDAVGDSKATLDVQGDGHITCVDWAMTSEGNANDDGAHCELSFGSTNTFGTNDSRQSISMIRNLIKDITAESGYNAVNKCVSGLRIRVSQGERLHLHTKDTSVDVECYVHVEDNLNPGVTRRR